MSTGGQPDGFGLEDEERFVRRRTREYGHRLTKLFVEKARSGTIAGDERPEPAGALLWVEDRKVHGIVAPSLDRLARELVVREAAPAQCWKRGGRAWSMCGRARDAVDRGLRPGYRGGRVVGELAGDVFPGMFLEWVPRRTGGSAPGVSGGRRRRLALPPLQPGG
ncbi:recombinase family protein [Streptomyces sp. BK340]|uniref:recombinase family protein n=1 Tax=Streptomyces sp. BK340 TaxID=2572903 RepID=UPI001644D1D0|nr:recombinase family protein [Streptomyces sp. BK340]